MNDNYFDFSELDNTTKEFYDMQKALEGEIKEIGQEIGQELKRNVEATIPVEEGNPKHGTHAVDEVKVSVRKKKESIKITAEGGKVMGGYWWLIDNGHVAQDGTFVPGAHFTDKAYEMTDVEGRVENLLSRIIK